MADLEMVLARLDMSDYLDRFLQNSFDTWQVLCEITEEDLEYLGVELGHRRKLQKEIARTRQMKQSPNSMSATHQSLRSGEVSNNPGMESLSTPPGKRGYRHHPRPDENAPQRPYSAYVMFSNHVREKIKGQSMPFTEISRLVGDRWQALPPAKKEEWKQAAAVPWEKYKQDLATYQKTEDFRKYEQYVANFKATQATKKNTSKRRGSQSQGVLGGSLQRQSPGSESECSSSAPTLPSIGSAQKNAEQFSYMSTEHPDAKQLEHRVPISRVRGQGAASSTATARGPRVTQGMCISHFVTFLLQDRLSSKLRAKIALAVFRNLSDEPSDGKRDKEKRMNEQLWKKAKAYETLLLDLAPQLDNAHQIGIQRALLLPPVLRKPGEEPFTKTRIEEDNSDDSTGNESMASGIGSMGSTDHVDYTEFESPAPDRNTPAYLGQSSEVAWMKRLNRELGKGPETRSTSNEHTAMPSAARLPSGRLNFEQWPEDMDSFIVGNQLDPYELPIKSTADALVKAFFSVVHPAFPILDKASFLQEYEQLFVSMETDLSKSGIAVAISHTVFAIGAVHAHMADSEWAGDDRDHLLYFARARVLGACSGLLSESVSLGQVQLLGLAGFYLIATDQTNRAWSALSLAIRCAQGLGMHLINVTPNMAKNEILHGIYAWCALVSTERALSVMLGRPCMVNEQDCSAPIPLPVGQEDHQSIEATSLRKSQTATSPMAKSRSVSSSSSRLPDKHFNIGYHRTKDQSLSMSWFFHYLELNRLAQRVTAGLYNPHIRHEKWGVIQRKIEEYDKQLTQWYMTLPAEFDLRDRTDVRQSEPLRAALAMLSYSTRTIINRPALCRTERRLLHQSDESIRYSQEAAHRCVNSARAMLRFLPGESEATNVNLSPIWWIQLHHMKRSATVLLLELAFRAEHMPSEAEEILADATKAINFIHSMGAVSAAARRSWTTLNRFLHLAAQRIGGSTKDLVTSPPEPQGCSTGRPYHQPMPPISRQPFDLDDWLPMTSGPGESSSNDPFYGDTHMGGMDQFGFMSTQQDQSFFPSATEMQGWAAQQQRDDDTEMWQQNADRSTWFGFDGGPYQ